MPLTPRTPSVAVPRRPPRRSRSAAFTLIELLTVVAIIGILAAILIPVVGSVREKARGVQCAANFRSLGVAVTAFANDNRDATPHFSDRPTLLNGQPVSWYLQLAPYLGADLTQEASTRNALRTMVCKSSVRSRQLGSDDVPWAGFVAGSGWPYISDYGYNSQVNNYNTAPGARRLTRIGDPKVPGQTPLIHELVSQNNFYAGTFNFPQPASDEAAYEAGGAQRQAFTTRHGGGGYILWFDAHISWMRYEDYMALAHQTSPWLFVNGGYN